MRVLVAATLAFLSAASATAQELPPIPQDLLGQAVLACIKIGDGGRVTEAFLIKPTGDAGRDHELVEWTRQLHWDKASPEEKSRNIWLPIGLALGHAKPPVIPATCAPPPA